MNWSKFFIAFIAAFVFLFVFGFIWYGNLMHGVHRKCPRFSDPKQSLAAIFHGSFLGSS
jgi:hypothetical protein